MVIQKETDCVLLAGRHQGLAEGIRGLLETAFQVVVMVANETSLFESAKRLPASLAVLDASLVGKGRFRVLRQLRETAPTLKLIVISAHDQSSVGQLAFNAGADAFVLQRAISTDLLPAVDAVRAGKRFVSRSTLSRIGFQQPHSTKFSDQH